MWIGTASAREQSDPRGVGHAFDLHVRTQRQSVDAQTRAELEDLLLTLQRDLGITVLLVTHDVDESVYLSDRVVVLGGTPALTQDIVDVPLTGARDQLTTKADPLFIECRTRVLSAIQQSKVVAPVS